MRSFNFRVISSDPDDKRGIPIAVAGQTMTDVQKLLTDIGCMTIRQELRLQNEIPEELRAKFDLRIGTTETGIGTAPTDGNVDSLESSMNVLEKMLDFLGTGAVGTWMTDMFPVDEIRSTMAQDIIDLYDHLKGYTLVYGEQGKEKEFRKIDRERIAAYTNQGDNLNAVVGIIARDRIKKNHWTLSNDEYAIPITFANNIAPSDIPSFANAGPLLVMGNVVRDESGHIARVDRIDGCYTFPKVSFHRIVSPKGDRVLLNTLDAIPSYDTGSGMWTLKNDIVGIDVSKPSWDGCVIAFHDYAGFLFETYVESGNTFEGEEQEINEYLKSLLPA